MRDASVLGRRARRTAGGSSTDSGTPRRGRWRRLFQLGAGAVALVGAVCGALVIGIAVPGVGAVVFGSETTVGGADGLPVAPDTQSQRSQVLDADGKVLAYFFTQNRVYVPLPRIAPVMQQAILAIEDHRFYQHGALDVRGTLRALVTNLRPGEEIQGGSTITQQYVKLTQIEQAHQRGDANGVAAAQDTSYRRKLRELRYAVAVESELSKDQILERYLNIAYFGDGAYGIEAAAEHYFSTTAATLTLPQAALLAGLVKSPAAFNPVNRTQAALDRRTVVLNRMREENMVAAGAVSQAERVRFDPGGVRPFRSGCLGTHYPFVCDYVYRSLLQLPSLGETVQERAAAVQRGGLTVQTAFDPRVQDQVQQAVTAVVGATDPVLAAVDVIEPGTGRILAMAQSRPVMGPDAAQGQTYWNFSAPPRMGGAQGFQAGSTFKAFTAAAALNRGFRLSTRYDARRVMDFSGAEVTSCRGRTRVKGSWKVRNSTGTSGVMDMYRAAERSVNTYFVQLALDVGMCDVVRMAERLGVESSTSGAPISSFDDKPSFTLGTVEVSPLTMAEAYATFAAGGVHCDPVILTSVADGGGRPRSVPTANCAPVISADVAAAMNALLGRVMTDGTGARAAIPDGRAQAGKTGTIDSNAATWFVGYTPQAAAAAVIGVDPTRSPFAASTGRPRRQGLKGFTVPSTGVWLAGTGSSDAGSRLWKPAMQSYLAGRPPLGFAPPPARLVGNGPD